MTRPGKVIGSGTIRGAAAARSRVEAATCPLETLIEEHFLQRQLTAEMERLAAEETPQPALARTILRNLCRDLPLHHRDETQSLFPRLRRRASPEDEIDPLLNRLTAEHDATAGAIGHLMPALICMAGGALPTAEDRLALRALAQAERRHLIVENAIVMPLARIRLSPADKAAMREEMRVRRLEPPPPCPACIGPLQRLQAITKGNTQ